MEARVRGPNITPGYWRDEALTRAAFDEEGYYRLGDAMRFVDPADPGKGLDLRRPAGRGLQALDRHVGQRRAAAGEDPRPGRRPRAGRRHRRPRSRVRRGAGLSEPARCAASSPALRRRRARVRGAVAIPPCVARFQDVFDDARRAEHRQLHVRRARDPARRAAVARRARDHRQGIDQPEGRAAAPRRARRRALRRSAARARAASPRQPASHAASRHR